MNLDVGSSTKNVPSTIPTGPVSLSEGSFEERDARGRLERAITSKPGKANHGGRPLIGFLVAYDFLRGSVAETSILVS